MKGSMENERGYTIPIFLDTGFKIIQMDVQIQIKYAGCICALFADASVWFATACLPYPQALPPCLQVRVGRSPIGVERSVQCHHRSVVLHPDHVR